MSANILDKCVKQILEGRSFMIQEDLEKMHLKYPQSSDILAFLIRANIDSPDKVYSLINSETSRDKVAQFALLEFYLFNKDEPSAYGIFKNVKNTYSNDFLTNCYEVIFDCYIFNKNHIRQYFSKAQELLKSLSAPQTDFELSVLSYIKILCEWVVSANQGVGTLNIDPYWKKFTENVFEYCKEYQEDLERIERGKKQREEEERQRIIRAKQAEEQRIAEEQRKAFEAKQLEELRIAAEQKRQYELKQAEDEKNKAAQYLNSFGISLGSFRDERDGNEYKTVTIGKQTWMVTPLRYLEYSGLCSLNGCVTQKKETGTLFYTWPAMMQRSENKISPHFKSKLLAAFIVTLVLLLVGFLFCICTNHTNDVYVLLFWAIVVVYSIFCSSILKSFFSSLGNIIHFILFFANAIITYNYSFYWEIWIPFSMIIAALSFWGKGVPFTTSARSIAPKGWRIPSKRDIKELDTCLNEFETYNKNAITNIQYSICQIANYHFMGTAFWLVDLVYDDDALCALCHSRKKIAEYTVCTKPNDIHPIICIKK